ncbi:MAG: dTDP-4-dehydrorhamnose reductase [Acidobacteria bacterium]|nr:dTDP-4-dehydrorhamnose reductase [Acidobacteriota bacterium]MCW5971540.1 dTDP-4-dehydrorhamnose reductase [Blastocatellales bacterium]
MKVIIAGAGGLLGARLTESLSSVHEVCALKRADLDITDGAAVDAVCLRERPDLVVNCAVAQVDPCEQDPQMAEAVNVAGPRNLARSAAAIGAAILHFSTNYVFEGTRTDGGFYTIDDETRPVNVYGRVKLAGERAVIEANPRSYIFRTSWVYGPGKESFLASVPKKLRKKESVQAIVDCYSSTTYVRDLARRTDEILARGRYGIYHTVNAGVCSYYEFAAEAARLLGLSEEQAAGLIMKRSESQMNRPALRPAWTPMACRLSDELGLAPMRDWRAALAGYVEEVLREEI